MLRFNTDFLRDKINLKSLNKKYSKSVIHICENVRKKIAHGSLLTDWMEIDLLQKNVDIDLIEKIKKEWIKLKIKNVVIIGIGGSYIGAKAIIDMLSPKDRLFNLFFVHNINSDFLLPILDKIGKCFGIVVISKSGKTIEPSVAFRIFRKKLEENVGLAQARKCISVVTSKNDSILNKFSSIKGYHILSIPNNIGGRFSTLTNAGLLPVSLAGIDIKKILAGARAALKELDTPILRDNTAYQYACYRYYFYTVKKLQIENFIVYDPNLTMIASQWQQLFGESEGKNGKALFPAYSTFTTDLHSLGQYLQQGTKNFFETTLIVDKPNYDIRLKVDNNNDGLQYLNNVKLSSITQKAFEGTIFAHSVSGKVNNLVVQISKADEFHYGYLFIWLAKAAMMSAYLLKLNPFDQPGVELYKNKMFELLRYK